MDRYSSSSSPLNQPHVYESSHQPTPSSHANNAFRSVLDESPTNARLSSSEFGSPFAASPQTPMSASCSRLPSHPLDDSTTTPITPTNNPSRLAQEARQEWRNHGAGVTQLLEEKRRQQQERPGGSFLVRVVSAETRVDLAGTSYTAYVLRVQLPPHLQQQSSFLTIEHRYSDFDKLNTLLNKHSIRLPNFPNKHWAGRVGNWTPSLQIAPHQYQDLIDYRKIQLDVWLVHVVDVYNQRMEQPIPASVQQAILDFLTLPNQPPCQIHNEMTQTSFITWNNPLSLTLGSAIRQATHTVQHMCRFTFNESDHSIPLALLHHCKGLCFMTVMKAGFVLSARCGTGLLLRKHSHQQWSAPCAVGTLGLGWGALVGGDVTHYLIVLTTHSAVDSFVAGGSLQLGAELGVAVGPVGRGATSAVASSGNDWSVHPAYAYAHSQGFFVGMSLEGSVVVVRNDVNAKFYGQTKKPMDILKSEPPPKAAEPLYQALQQAMKAPIVPGSLPPFLQAVRPSDDDDDDDDDLVVL